MEEDMMLAAKKLAPILISVALLAVGLTANSGAARADSPGPGGTPPARATVAVDTGTSLGVIPPVAFGLNASAYDGALLDPAVPGLVRAAGVGIMRYPGGAEADVYHWQDNTITPITPGNLGGYANPNDTYDNFMKVASGAGAQAMLTVNYGSNISGTAGGDPQEAAAWVRDANVVKHYGVTYWEIGNEVYGNGTYGPYFETDLHPDKGPAAYANHALEYIAAMKAVDPSIKIGAVLTAPGNYPDGQTSSLSPQPWNDTVLPILCPAVDFVDVHWYPQDPASQSNNPLPESDARLLQSPAQGNGTRTPSIPAMVATLRAKIAQYCPSRAAQIQIMITETNSVSYNPGKQTVSLVNALFLDDNYMTWLEHGVTNVDWFQLHNSPMTGANINTSPSLYGTATYGDYGILSYGQSPEPAADTPFPPYYGLQMLTNLGRPAGRVIIGDRYDHRTRRQAGRRQPRRAADQQGPCRQLRRGAVPVRLYAGPYPDRLFVWHEQRRDLLDNRRQFREHYGWAVLPDDARLEAVLQSGRRPRGDTRTRERRTPGARLRARPAPCAAAEAPQGLTRPRARALSVMPRLPGL